MSVLLALASVCAYMLPPNNKEPSELYQEKIEAVEKANKELKKFLIDYPEFREEQDDEFEQNKAELTKEELEKEAEYIKMQRNLIYLQRRNE